MFTGCTHIQFRRQQDVPMKEHARREQPRMSCILCQRDRNSRFDNVMIIFTLLLYCFIYIEKVQGDTFPAMESLNVSSNEPQQLSIEETFDTNISISDLQSEQNATAVDDINIPTATTNTTDIYQQQSENHTLVQNDSIAMSYDDFTMQDDDYTYDDDVTFVTYKNEVAKPSNDDIIAQDTQERDSDIDEVESELEEVTESKVSVVNVLMNDTAILSNMSALESDNVLDDAGINETTNLSHVSASELIIGDDAMESIDQFNENITSELEQTILEPDGWHESIQQEKEAVLQGIPILESTLLESNINDTMETNVVKELENDSETTDDSSISEMAHQEDIVPDHSMNDTLSQKNPKSDAETCSHQDNNQTYHYYCSTIWGDKNVTRRRPSTNLSILEQLFLGVTDLTDPVTFNSTARIYKPARRETSGRTSNNNISGSDSVDALGETPLSPQNMNLVDDVLIDNHDDELSKENEDLMVLDDDMDDFFQNADVTDEFDVSTKDSSIQEVLMGSASRIVIKRFTIAGQFVWNKARIVQKYLFQQVQNVAENNESLQKLLNRLNDVKELKWLSPLKAGEFAFLRWTQDEDGEFAPLRRLRNSEGQWMFVQNLKNSDGKLLGISNHHIQKGLEWIQINAMNTFQHVDHFLDTILSGSSAGVDDEMEFKFLADKDFIKHGSVADT